MYKIVKYAFIDLVRSKWTFFYAGFYLVLTLSLFLLNTDIAKVIITLMNLVLVLVPLIATIFGVMYYYQSRDFIELLLAQPIPRRTIFLGQYTGIASSLSLCLLLGVGMPFVAYGIFYSDQVWNYLVLLVTGVLLSAIFSALAYLMAMYFDDRIKGFGIAIFIWLFFAIIYDGLLLLGLAYFSDYPLETPALVASLFNPIDLSRILILLKLDISALMGYTGAVFQKFLGNSLGILIAFGILFTWVVFPAWMIGRLAIRKDF